MRFLFYYYQHFRVSFIKLISIFRILIAGFKPQVRYDFIKVFRNKINIYEYRFTLKKMCFVLFEKNSSYAKVLK